MSSDLTAAREALEAIRLRCTPWQEYGDKYVAGLCDTAIAQLRAAEAEQGWRLWPDDNDEGEYPPDETDVEIYCGKWTSKERVIGRISKARGTYGPSGASHWKHLSPPPAREGK